MIGRLHGRRDFENLRTRGRAARGRLLGVRYVPGDQGVRVAYAIPRRVGTAVRRNRVRRQLRAMLHMMQRDGDPRLRDGDYVVRVHADAHSADWNALRGDLVTLLGELHREAVR